MRGTRLGTYVIDHELGSGGMGTVYAATVHDRCPGLAIGTRVALKVLHPHLLDAPGFFERFLREGEIGEVVQHENVVRTLACEQFVAAGVNNSYLVMEYVEGQTLRELLTELERVPEELCRHVAREICKGLAAIHAAGVIHRDIKPDNVLITDDHVVKVMDLGVAKLQDEALRLSQTGAFVGSIHYAAPECFQDGGAAVDGRADLHSLGLLLYELSCGSNPYVADSVPQVLRRVLHEEPRRLGDVNPQLSPFFEEVVHCLLAKDREQRFASAAALLAVLEDGEDSEWWHARSRAIRAETRRPLRRIRIPRETAVYGREPELALLHSLYTDAAAANGQVVVVQGEAGIGKSRLIDELIGRLQRDGEDINFLFGCYPPNGAATASGAFSLAYREQFGEAGCAAYLGHLEMFVPAFDALLTGAAAPPDVEPLTKDSLQACFVHATRALAAERPTVVLIDDLHFAPEEGRQLFTSLAMAVPGHRILLVGTTRPGETEAWQCGLDRLDHSTRMAPQRLAAKDLAQLLEDAFKSRSLAEALGFKIIVKSDGNPFFAFEIIRGLREGHFITQEDDGTWVSTRVIDLIEVPSSVLELVKSRVAELTQEERDLLDVAACWGFEFDPAVIAAAVGEPLLPTLKRFASIEQRHRLVRASGRMLVFDHHQVQEALYGALYEQMREEYHAALAAALETRTGAADGDPESLDGSICASLCEHYLKGARGEAALRYLPAAQAHLTDGCLHADVAALAERALAMPNLLTGAARAEALLRLGSALDPLGRRERQEECLREAEQLAQNDGDDDLRCRAARALGGVLWRTARHAAAEAAFRRALSLARDRGDRSAEAGITGNLGSTFLTQHRLSEARQQCERSLALCHDLGDRAGEARATGNLGLICHWEGRFAAARGHLEQQLALSRQVADRAGEAAATSNLGMVSQAEGRLSDALEHHERFLALSRRRGDRVNEAVATGNVGSVLQAEGRLPEAQAQLERYLALTRETGNRTGEAIALHNLANVLTENDDHALAETRLLECLTLSEQIGSRSLTAAAHLALGAARAAAGNEEGGREALVSARDLAVESELPGYETLAQCHLARLSGGDASRALTLFAANQDQLDFEERRVARWLLFGATGDADHLAEAKRLLDEALSNVPEEHHAAMCANLRVNREILAASRARDGGA